MKGSASKALSPSTAPGSTNSQQRLRASQIVRLSGREHHLDGIAERIDQGVDFGGQPAARAADRLFAVFFRAPALCW